MPRYRWVGPTVQSIDALGLTVVPGEEFDSPEPINHPHAELVEPKPAKTKENG